MNAGRMNLLEQEDFNAFFSGCLRTVQSDSGLLLHRHTAKQIAYYEETNESWAIRSRCPAGIKLNLHSLYDGNFIVTILPKPESFNRVKFML